MYYWRKNKMFSKKMNAQIDLDVVKKALTYTIDNERVNLEYQIPVCNEDRSGFDLERFSTIEEYLIYLECGNKDGYL